MQQVDDFRAIQDAEGTTQPAFFPQPYKPRPYRPEQRVSHLETIKKIKRPLRDMESAFGLVFLQIAQSRQRICNALDSRHRKTGLL